MNAQWDLVTTIPTGNAHSDLDFFTRGGDTFASVGTLGNGPNAGGQTIVRLTDKGEVKPSYVTGHPSASCITTTTSATGLQHDVEATPKGESFPQQPNPFVPKGDAQLLVEATDASGRCHDQGVLGQQAPQGGLEIIDITDPAKPKEIGLTVHLGKAHTVNIEPKRPHISFDVTQDGVPIEADDKQANEVTASNQMDGFEVVDLSSCMNSWPARPSPRSATAAARMSTATAIRRRRSGSRTPTQRSRAATSSRSTLTTGSPARASTRRRGSTCRAPSTTTALRATSSPTSPAARRCPAGCAPRARRPGRSPRARR